MAIYNLRINGSVESAKKILSLAGMVFDDQGYVSAYLSPSILETVFLTVECTEEQLTMMVLLGWKVLR